MDRWRSRSEEREIERERDGEKKEDAGAQKVSRVSKLSVYPMVCGSRRSKNSLAKAAGAETSGPDEK